MGLEKPPLLIKEVDGILEIYNHGKRCFEKFPQTLDFSFFEKSTQSIEKSALLISPIAELWVRYNKILGDLKCYKILFEKGGDGKTEFYIGCIKTHLSDTRAVVSKIQAHLKTLQADPASMKPEEDILFFLDRLNVYYSAILQALAYSGDGLDLCSKLIEELDGRLHQAFSSFHQIIQRHFERNR